VALDGLPKRNGGNVPSQTVEIHPQGRGEEFQALARDREGRLHL